MDKESAYLLQKLDCNCNDCGYMERDLVTYQKWEDWHRALDLAEFEKKKAKALADAVALKDAKERQSALNIANKMKFHFEKKWLLQYGNCQKFKKQVYFTPGECRIETQECFVHRKDMVK